MPSSPLDREDREIREWDLRIHLLWRSVKCSRDLQSAAADLWCRHRRWPPFKSRYCSLTFSLYSLPSVSRSHWGRWIWEGSSNPKMFKINQLLKFHNFHHISYHYFPLLFLLRCNLSWKWGLCVISIFLLIIVCSAGYEN